MKLLLALSVVAWAVGARAADPTNLTVDDALARAHRSAPTLRAAAARLVAARSDFATARSSPPPTVSVGHGAGGGTGGLDEDLILSAPLEPSAQRVARVAGARADVDAEAARADAARLDLDFAVRTAYADAVRADAEVTLAEEQRAQARALYDAAQDQLRAGDVAQVTVARARIESLRADQVHRDAIRDRDNRRAALASRIGVTDPSTVRLTDPLPAEAPPLAPEPLLERALAADPALREARAERSRRRAAVAAARAERRPSVTIEARRSRIDAIPAGNSLRVGLTAPIDMGRIAGEVRASQARVDEQEAQVEEIERLVRLGVETARRNYDAARQAVSAFPDDRLVRAREVADLAALAFERGAGSLLELIDARQALRSESVAYVRARADLAIARAALMRSVGGELP